MGVIKRVVRAKTHKGKRELEKREPKLIENSKSSIFLRGNKCSEAGLHCLKDFAKLRQPFSVVFNQKQDFRPFEATNELEAFCKKYDSSLFAFTSQNKKRPNNVIIGRTFDHQVLDMVELGITKFRGMNDFPNAKVGVGIKPCLTFAGEPFLQSSSDFLRLKNLFVDFFRGEEVTNIRLEGIEHVLSFMAVDDKLYMRSYRIILKKSGEKTPYTELEEIGPSVDFVLRRTKFASPDLFKSACKKPKELKIKKVKNVSKDVFGSKLGRVHIGKQDYSRIATKNMKGLRKTMAEKKMERAEKTKAHIEERSTQSDSEPGSSLPSVHTSAGATSIKNVANLQKSGPMKLNISS